MLPDRPIVGYVLRGQFGGRAVSSMKDSTRSGGTSLLMRRNKCREVSPRWVDWARD